MNNKNFISRIDKLKPDSSNNNIEIGMEMKKLEEARHYIYNQCF